MRMTITSTTYIPKAHHTRFGASSTSNGDFPIAAATPGRSDSGVGTPPATRRGAGAEAAAGSFVNR